MGCEQAGCWGNQIQLSDYCLAHSQEVAQQRFLDRVGTGALGLDGRLRGLEIEPGLFDRLCPVLPKLDEYVDFTGSVFPSGTDFGKLRFARKVIFNGVRFAGEVRFAGVTFAEQAWFNGAIFAGRAVFGASAPYYFSGAFQAQAEGATFEATAEFIGAQFHDDAQFDWVLFKSDVDFGRAQFLADYRLEDLRPPDGAPMISPQSGRVISFHNARFHGGVIATLPAARVEAAGVEIGGASRLVIRGPIALDRITLNHPLTILTAKRAEAVQLREAGFPPELASLSGATLQAPLILGNGVSLQRCMLMGAVGLEQLGLHVGTSPLTVNRRRRVLFDEVLWRRGDQRRGHRLVERFSKVTWEQVAESLEPFPTYGRLDPGPIAGRYRQLRHGLEEARNAPGAADFYYGEMEMRRAATPSRFERFFLWLYWLVSGYGLRASRSIAAYLAVVAAATALFRYGSPDLREPCPPNQDCPDLDDWWSIAVFVIRWSVSLFPSPDTTGISTGGQAVLLVLRFVSPVLLALTFLAVRTRVHR